MAKQKGAYVVLRGLSYRPDPDKEDEKYVPEGRRFNPPKHLDLEELIEAGVLRKATEDDG